MGALDGGIRDKVGLNPTLRALMLPATLITQNVGFVNGRQVTSPVSYPALGFVDTRRTAVAFGGATTISGSAERICVLLGLNADGNPIPEPKAQDRITIQGQTHGIQTVERDPAGATWTCTLTVVS